MTWLMTIKAHTLIPMRSGSSVSVTRWTRDRARPVSRGRRRRRKGNPVSKHILVSYNSSSRVLIFCSLKYTSMRSGRLFLIPAVN